MASFDFQDLGLLEQKINQSINTWDGVAPIIRARGSCIKRMTIKNTKSIKIQCI